MKGPSYVTPPSGIWTLTSAACLRGTYDASTPRLPVVHSKSRNEHSVPYWAGT
ncbi:hypothetical protein OE88DRAFT_1659030 [Heliocybe sulcata]|uniref:Uncharacterized protein n=1 Tax=Heliocybe sulcata TaxID=5364 RepID=A0A5C3N4Z4_9AGAM|nr:hypothetical protein OE88DRAFT_1659030 [Heliocybe sulcata]